MPRYGANRAVAPGWLNRDPAGYVDSMNLYGYGVSNPIGGMDPYGLNSADDPQGPFPARGFDPSGSVPITFEDMVPKRPWELRERWWNVYPSGVLEYPRFGYSPQYVDPADRIHDALDAAGMIPGAGEVADGTNGILYLVDGEWKYAALAFGAMIPLFGNWFTALKHRAKHGAKLATHVDVDDVAEYLRYWERYAPGQYQPYGFYRIYNPDGSIKEVITYDSSGRRIRQYEMSPISRHGPGCHTYEYNEICPRQDPGGGSRSPHHPFE